MYNEQHTRCQFVSKNCIYSNYMLKYKEFSSAPHTVCQEVCEDLSTHPLQKQHLFPCSVAILLRLDGEDLFIFEREQCQSPQMWVDIQQICVSSALLISALLSIRAVWIGW